MLLPACRAAPSDSSVCCCLHLAMLQTPHTTMEERFHLKQVSGNAWDMMLMQTNQYATRYLLKNKHSCLEKRLSQELTFTGCFCIRANTPLYHYHYLHHCQRCFRMSGTEAERVVFPYSHFPFSCKCFHAAEPNREQLASIQNLVLIHNTN